MGSSGGGSSTSYIKSAAPGALAPIAPTRTAAGEQPENVDQAQFTSGTKRTDAESIASGLGSSRLVIPIKSTLAKKPGDNAQSGGTTTAPTASPIVGG